MDKVRGGKLRLKGGRSLASKSEKKKRKAHSNSNISSTGDKETQEHGGWRRIVDDADLKAGSVAIESATVAPNCYLMSMDNGRFTIGPPHNEALGLAPSAEEVLTLAKHPDDRWLTLKTGFGRYVGIDTGGMLVGVAEAVGPREKWELVFQDGKMALQASFSSCFLSFDTDKEGYVFAPSKIAKESEMIIMRTNREVEKPTDLTPNEDRKGAADCEATYSKLFSHSKVPLHLDTTAVKRAKFDGDLHTTLLDRREKMKSDRYCK